MRREPWRPLGAVTAAVLSLLYTALPAHAQPILESASPAPDSILPAPPRSIELTFDQALIEQGTSIRVTDLDGNRFDRGDVRIDPTNRFAVSVRLTTLIEGLYTVAYTAAGVGSSTVLVGSYQFTVDLPPPTLALLEPVNGHSYAMDEPVSLEMQTQFFDFALYNNRIRIYVDGDLQAEVRSLEYEFRGLTPGVHQIKVVLAQFDDQEIPESQITVYVAVAQPDPESEGRISAAEAPPDPGLRLTPLQLVIVTLLTLILLAFGLWLGRTTSPPMSPED